MANRSKHSRSKPQRFQLEVVSNCFLTLAFSFFFVFAQASDFLNAEFKGTESNKASTLHQAVQLIADEDYPPHVPVNSVPLPPESESKSERETSDNSDDDTDKIFAGLSIRAGFNLTSGKCLLLHLLNSWENRKAVSLIILHHSWKSFLS